MRIGNIIEFNQFNGEEHQAMFLFNCYIIKDFIFSVKGIKEKFEHLPQCRRLVFDFAIFKFPFQIIIRLNKTGKMRG